MVSWRVIPLALVGLLFAVPAVKAQEGPVKVATCNPAKVFEGMDERKAIEDKMRAERDKVQAEVQRRKQEVADITKQRDELKPDSAQYREKSSQLMQKAVDFEVWARLTQAEMARAEKAQIGELYGKIREAAKEVAEARKIDLVLAERKPVIPDNDQLTPDQFRALISQTDGLYATEKADITQLVIVSINKKYATGAPAAPAAPVIPVPAPK